ncbi:MAG: hypothetical protein AB7L09_02840 [Nitrospira sp.]
MSVPVVAQSLQIATISIEGVSALLFGGMVDKDQHPKMNKETHDAYEKRTWRERCHANERGELYIPAFGLKRMLENTARHKGDKIAGKGNKTRATKFKCGVQVQNDLLLKPIVLKSDVDGLWKHVPSDGKSGGGTRVPRCFPILQRWGGSFDVLLLDEEIQREWVEEYAVLAGVINGIGTWRPQNGGNYGRFRVTDISWKEFGSA